MGNFYIWKWFVILFGAWIGLLMIPSCASNNQDIYVYIDNQEDFDRHRDIEFEPGTIILFNQNGEFEGQFAPRGSGTQDRPIRVTGYNPESGEIFWENMAKKPVIHGRGQVNAPFYLFNGHFWEINNLEITNTDGSEKDQGDLRGIHVVAKDAGTIEHVVIRYCYVHDVNGKVGGKQRGGIHFNVYGDSLKTKFDGVTIEDNVVMDVGGVGIANQSSWPGIKSPDYYPWINLVIRGNHVERTGRNGIIVRYSIHPLVEYNTLAYNSRYSTGHSVFNFNTIGCVVQFNEAYGNTSNNPEDIDHGGFDADYNSKGTIIQYNYSHDNNWFCGIMRRGVNSDVTIRYNISQNELLGAYLYGFPGEKGVEDVKVYNNVHYFGKGKGDRIFVRAGKFRTPTQTTFWNNIFYFSDQAEWGFEPDSTCSFFNNVYYNVAPRGERSIIADPLFVNPGSVGSNIDMRNREIFHGYRLQNNSPAIKAGVLIHENGSQDFMGNPIDANVPDVGAIQH